MYKQKYQPSESTNYLTLKQAVEYFNICATTVDKKAKECGAKIKIGRSSRYKKDKLEAYLDNFIEE